MYYLSSAAGAPCPFARAGLAVPVSHEPVPGLTADLPSRKRKRRATVSTAAAALDPGPQPQRPKLMLRIPRLQPPQQSPATAPAPAHDSSSDDTDDESADDDVSNDSLFHAFPHCEPVRIPAYNPHLGDLDARIYAADEYASDVEPPPDSEDEDDDFHNSMLRPPGRDFFGLVPDTGSSPESSASVDVDVKQELSRPVIIKTEPSATQALWRERWAAGTSGGLGVKMQGQHFDLGLGHGASVIHINHQRSWAALARDVIDLTELDDPSGKYNAAQDDTARATWRFPSVVSSGSDVSDDLDMFDLDPIKREELIGKLEPIDVVLSAFSDPKFASGNEALASAADREAVASVVVAHDVKTPTPVTVATPAAIPDELLEEVTARVQATARGLECLPIEPVAAEDFDADWPTCSAMAQRLCSRRATIALPPICGSGKPQQTRPRIVTASDSYFRPGRSASFSCMAPSPWQKTPCSDFPQTPLTPGPRGRNLHPTRKQFTPTIVATTVATVPVFQTFLDAHRLLRRVDTDFVNITPLMRFLRIRLDVQDAACATCVVVTGADMVEGLWAPLEIAQRLVRSQPPLATPLSAQTTGQRTLDPPTRLPEDVARGFLLADLCDEFLPAVREARTLDRRAEFGASFGMGELVLPLSARAEDEDDAMDLDNVAVSRKFWVNAAGTSWNWPKDIAELPVVPLASLGNLSPIQLVQPRAGSIVDVVHPELASAAASISPSNGVRTVPLIAPATPLPALSLTAVTVAIPAGSTQKTAPVSVARRVIPRRAAAQAPIIEVDDESDLTDLDEDDEDSPPRKRPAPTPASSLLRKRGRTGKLTRAASQAVAAGSDKAAESESEAEAPAATFGRGTRRRRLATLEPIETASSSAASSSPAPDTDTCMIISSPVESAAPEATSSPALRRSSRRAKV